MNYGYVMDSWASEARRAEQALEGLLESGELNAAQTTAVEYALRKFHDASLALTGDVLPDDYPA